MGIRVLFDEAVVFSCREFFIFRDILEKGDKSPYKTWYKNVDFQGDSSFHDGFSYASWKRKEQYPLFNFDDEDLRIYIIDQIKAWIQRFDIDGIRIANCTSLDILTLLYRTNETGILPFGRLTEGGTATVCEFGNAPVSLPL